MRDGCDDDNQPSLYMSLAAQCTRMAPDTAERFLEQKYAKSGVAGITVWNISKDLFDTSMKCKMSLYLRTQFGTTVERAPRIIIKNENTLQL